MQRQPTRCLQTQCDGCMTSAQADPNARVLAPHILGVWQRRRRGAGLGRLGRRLGRIRCRLAAGAAAAQRAQSGHRGGGARGAQAAARGGLQVFVDVGQLGGWAERWRGRAVGGGSAWLGGQRGGCRRAARAGLRAPSKLQAAGHPPTSMTRSLMREERRAPGGVNARRRLLRAQRAGAAAGECASGRASPHTWARVYRTCTPSTCK